MIINILIAADSFKDALPASAVCRSIEAGIKAAWPDAQVCTCPLADGGEGTYDALATPLNLQALAVPAVDPLFRPMVTTYGFSPEGRTAFIEMAKTAGLERLRPEERNPLWTTSYGTGMQIADALRRNAQRIILAIGGSATNDAGIGMAAALGWNFFDRTRASLSPVGNNLNRIRTIGRPADLPAVRVEVLCDVTNPLYGPDGAARVFAPQKGAGEAAIEQLDDGLRQFAGVVAQSGDAPDPMFPGTGAAGGMGFGAMYFLKAELRRGVDVVLDLVGIDEKLRWADLVITGEGAIDAQTAHGKLIHGLCSRAAQYGTPVIAFCGRLEATESEIRGLGLRAAYVINDPDDPAELMEKLQHTGRNLERTVRRTAELFLL